MSFKFTPQITDRTLAWFCLWVLIIAILGTAAYNFYIRGITLTIAFFAIFLPIFFIDSLKTLIEVLVRKHRYQAEEDLSKVTVIIPCHNGGDFLAQTVNSLLTKFPPEAIIVSSNGSTDNTVALAQALGVACLNNFHTVGKVEAINQALKYVYTPYTLIMDDDVIIGNATIPTNALDQGYQAAAFRVFPIKTNYLTIIQSHEYRKSMDIGRMFHNATGTVQNVSGAIGLFHTDELRRQINLHSGEFSGEDLQRTLLIHLTNHPKGVIMANSIVKTDVPDTISTLFIQRALGWNPGLYANLLNYAKLLCTPHHIPLRLRYEAFYNTVLLTFLDPIRIGGLSLLFTNPAYLATTYAIYITIEASTWLAMGKKEPFWVIAIYPLYGVFNLVARAVAGAVFIYRRGTVLIHRSQLWDSYRHANSGSRAASWGLAIFSFIFALYGSTEVTTEINSGFENPTARSTTLISPLADSTQSKVLGISIQAPPASPTPTSSPPQTYTYIAQPGDSRWKLSRDAINEYLNQNQLPALTAHQQNLAAHYLLSISNLDNIIIGQPYTFTESDIIDAILHSLQ